MGIKRRYVAGLVVLMLVVLGVEVVSTIRQQSLTWDEGDHIFAGYEIWKTGDFGLNPEHPPLVKMLGTIPLLGLQLKAPPLQGRFFKDEAYLDGRDLLFGNAPRYGVDTLMLRTRLAVGSLTLVLALLVFFAGQEMFGTGAGLLALLMFVFEPNLLAHGAYVTTDMAVSCMLFGAVYAFYRYVKVPSVGRLVVTGLVSGLALAAKHSAVLLLPMLLLLVAGEVLFRERTEAEVAAGAGQETRGRIALRLAGAIGVVVVIGVVVLWGFYGFRYEARPAGLKLDPSLAQYVMPLRPVEAHGILLLGQLHILPESFLYGLADVRSMANGMSSYIFGKVYAHGVWFYFPAVFVIKSTLGFLGMLLLAVVAIVSGRLRHRREVLFLTVPPLFYLLIAMGSSLNIGARHILLLYVFFIVLAAGGAMALVRADRRWGWAVAALVLMHVGSSALAYPNYISYSNEAWGGPTKTYRYLSDSNTDWGQQLKGTKAYVDQHGIKDCWIAYFVAPFVLPSDYGIPCKQLPTPDSWFTHEVIDVPAVIHGPVFISAGDLNSFEFGASALGLYEGFRSLKPTAFIQDGMFVFEGDFAIPQASALSHTQRSAALLKEKNVPDALAEAEKAESLTPGEYRAEMAMGDALVAAGRSSEAKGHYERALEAARKMEGGASEKYVPVVEKKLAALG
jgi:4-amino-4-deoxy-L-arabinose transferase-like glycosyltransferase